jgi:Zn-dependent protease
MGIEIQLHYSWFFIFLLITASLALGYMPHHYPGLSQETYWLIGASSAGILFTSVLFHELSHSFVAMRKGIRIPSIMLYFFGGVAKMAEEPRTPSDEMKMSIAGPLFSFAIGGILLFLWLIAESANLGVELSAVFRYGGYINLFVGAFNMMPAYPMDGGRVLRAAFWRRSKDVVRATISAAKISIIFSYALIFGSFPVFFFTRDASGIYLIFIGLYLKSTAESSLRHTVLSRNLEGAYAVDIVAFPVTVSPNTTLEEFSEVYGRVEQKRFPVVDNEVLVGIFETGDMKKTVREKLHVITVKHLMHSLDEYIVVTPNTSANDILSKMAERETNEVLVVAENRLVGKVSYYDLIKYARLRTLGYQ